MLPTVKVSQLILSKLNKSLIHIAQHHKQLHKNCLYFAYALVCYFRNMKYAQKLSAPSFLKTRLEYIKLFLKYFLSLINNWKLFHMPNNTHVFLNKRIFSYFFQSYFVTVRSLVRGGGGYIQTNNHSSKQCLYLASVIFPALLT